MFSFSELWEYGQKEAIHLLYGDFFDTEIFQGWQIYSVCVYTEDSFWCDRVATVSDYVVCRMKKWE